MESESQAAQAVRAAVEEACGGLEVSKVEFVATAPRHSSRFLPLAGWRIPAAVAALLVLALLLSPLVRRLVPEKQSVAGDRDSWTEEIQVTYETGLRDETTLVSHDSGVTTIIEIQVSYEQ